MHFSLNATSLLHLLYLVASHLMRSLEKQHHLLDKGGCAPVLAIGTSGSQPFLLQLETSRLSN